MSILVQLVGLSEYNAETNYSKKQNSTNKLETLFVKTSI